MRKAILLGLCGLMIAGVAFASVPDPTKSTCPYIMVSGSPHYYIDVGGVKAAATNPGVPDPAIAFTVTVNDFASAPIPGSTVEVNFLNCIDTKLCSYQPAGQTINCPPSKAIYGSTNAAGQVTFSILGASDNAGTTVPPNIWRGAGLNCATIYADGIPLCNPTVILYDQNGSLAGGNGVSTLDLSVLKTDVGAVGLGAAYKGRSDYNHDKAISSVDLSYHKVIVGNAGLGNGSGGGCGSGGAQPYCAL